MACLEGAGRQVEHPDHERIQNVHLEAERIVLGLLLLCEEDFPRDDDQVVGRLDQGCFPRAPFSIERISSDP